MAAKNDPLLGRLSRLCGMLFVDLDNPCMTFVERLHPDLICEQVA
jgi:hypothetical protein